MHLQMLQVARLAPKILGESSELVRDFFVAQQNPDGGFKDRIGRSDLYYTVFGIQGLVALESAPKTEALEAYLRLFGTGNGLDFVHLCCLARCHAVLAALKGVCLPLGNRVELSGRVECFRSGDGGYNVHPESACGTAYACYLGLAAYQDLHLPLPDSLRMVQSLRFLETSDGAWTNERGINVGATNSTAAVVTLLHQLNMPLVPSAGNWLLAQCRTQGGFSATPSSPLPDLLSTATALHALAILDFDFNHRKEACLDFIDSLWTNEGGFHGHWGDDAIDCEYTYYGLLALGHLAL